LPACQNCGIGPKLRHRLAATLDGVSYSRFWWWNEYVSLQGDLDVVGDSKASSSGSNLTLGSRSHLRKPLICLTQSGTLLFDFNH
jgi:hypothetical protein